MDNPPHLPSHTLPYKEIYKLTPLRSAYRLSVVFWAALILQACTVVQQKGERYVEMTEKFYNPEQVEVTYVRKGDAISGMECRCFGEACKQPPFAE